MVLMCTPMKWLKEYIVSLYPTITTTTTIPLPSLHPCLYTAERKKL